MVPNKAIITDVRRHFGLYFERYVSPMHVAAFAQYCERQCYLDPATDYEKAFARITQVISNYAADEDIELCLMRYTSDADIVSLGMNLYVIGEGWNIIGRERYAPVNNYKGSTEVAAIMLDIDSMMPASQRLPESLITAVPMSYNTIKVGDTVWRKEYIQGLKAQYISAEVVGVGPRNKEVCACFPEDRIPETGSLPYVDLSHVGAEKAWNDVRNYCLKSHTLVSRAERISEIERYRSNHAVKYW